VFAGGERLQVTRRDSMTTTRSITQVVEEELSRALDIQCPKINAENCHVIFKHKIYRTRITWNIVCCEVCLKPNILHKDPWSEECGNTPINQNWLGEYIEQLKNHRRIQQMAVELEPCEEEEEETETQERPSRLARSGRDKPQYNKFKFPIWKENLTWSAYEPMINWYMAVSKKEPEVLFMELVNALITTRDYCR